jgi:protein-tyrosine phosphatase
MERAGTIARKRVLFVCTANMCRSVMAEWGFRDMLERKELWQFVPCSAGVAAVPGLAPTENTLLVLSERGIDASAHRSVALDRDLVETADIVLGMSRAHVNMIAGLLPDARKKPFVLREFSYARDGRDIPDPIGLSLDQYRSCFRVIEDCFDGLLGHLRGEAG